MEAQHPGVIYIDNTSMVDTDVLMFGE